MGTEGKMLTQIFNAHHANCGKQGHARTAAFTLKRINKSLFGINSNFSRYTLLTRSEFIGARWVQRHFFIFFTTEIYDAITRSLAEVSN